MCTAINSQTVIAAVYDSWSRERVKFISIQCDVPVERNIDKNYGYGYRRANSSD